MTDSVLAEFGKKYCDVPDVVEHINGDPLDNRQENIRIVTQYKDCWVKFKTSGYPRKLRREVDAAQKAAELWAIVMRYVEAWHIRNIDGQEVTLPDVRPIEIADDIDEPVFAWINRAFYQFWLTELTAPRPNSSPPLATTPTA